MDKIFQKFCNLYPHYKINTKFKKKIFYIFFSLFKPFIKGPIKLNFKDFFFYAYPQRKNYSRSLLKKAELHDEREINFFIKNIDDKSIFLDCGANQGFYTIPVAASNKNCKIIAFEPSNQEMKYLNQNISLNNIKNIETSYLGIGDKEGYFKFKNDNLEDNSTKGGLIVEDENKNDGNKVIKVTTLDKFINDRKNEISSDTKLFIKIDLEGYDINAVYGSKNIIKNYFTVLLVEFSKMAVASKVYSKSDFDKFIKENDLSILDISGKQLTLDSIHSMLNNLKGNHQVCGNFVIVKEKLLKNLKFNSYN